MNHGIKPIRRNNLVVTNKNTENLNDPKLNKRSEASEYYNNKVRLIAKLIDKHNQKHDDENKPQTMTLQSVKKSKKKRDRDDTNLNFNSHFTASFPSNQYPNNGLNPFKTTKLDRQFKRVIHIGKHYLISQVVRIYAIVKNGLKLKDHNKRFNSKSNNMLGENSSVTSEKPIQYSKKQTKTANSLIKLSKMLDKGTIPSSKSSKSGKLVKLKFPAISNSNDYDNDKEDVFASSSFVKSESVFKDTIKS